jgi:hypothetical protein
VERPFAHLYETGGMRRVHPRGHTNILKRLQIHIGGFNLGLLLRQLIGVGTPRGLQGRLNAVLAALLTLIRMLSEPLTRHWCPDRRFFSTRVLLHGEMRSRAHWLQGNSFHHGLLGRGSSATNHSLGGTQPADISSVNRR